MVGVILVNEHQFLSYAERNVVPGSIESHNVQLPFCYRLQRISRFPLNLKILHSTQNFCLTKVKRRRINALAKQDAYSRQIDESVLREELEFKPSFDEYLKAMETVRTGRGKKYEEDDPDKREPKNPSMAKDGPRTPSSRRDAQDEEWIKLCAVLTQEKDLEESSKDEEDGLSESSFKGELKLNDKTERTKLEHKPWRKVEVSKAESAKTGIRSDRSANSSSNRDREQRLGLKKVKSESYNWNRDTASESINDVGGSEMRGKGRVGGTRDEVAHVKWRSLRNDSVETSDVRGKGRVGETRDEFENVKWKSVRTGGAGTSEMRSKGQVGSLRNSVETSDVRGKGRVGETRDEFENVKWKSVRAGGVGTSEMRSKGQVGSLRNSVETSDVRGKGRVGETRDEFENVKWKSVRAGGVGTSEMRSKGQVGRIRDEVENVERRSLRYGKKSIVEGRDDDVDFGMERAAFKNIAKTTDVVDPPKVSRMEMEERIQRLAKSLNGADIEIPEWMFSKMMLSAQIRFSDHSIMRVIQLLGKLGNWRRVLQVISWLQKRERFKSHKIRHIYTAALDVLGKARRPVEALNIFHAMQQQMASYPDLVAYHSIAVTLGQAGHMKELFDVIDLMRAPPKKKLKASPFVKWDPQVEPDAVVYNAVLNACVKKKQWEGAFWVLQQLKEQRAVPSATTYGLVMEVMFACGKYNLVHEFFRKVQKVGIPNALTYKVLVNTLWKEGKIDEAILAVEQMERRGVVGSAALYYDLARCLCSAGRSQEALLQMDKICRVATKPLVVTYTGLIQACLDSGKIQDGISIFQQMEKYCSPNLVTCNIMLKAYLENDMFEEANKLFLKMLEDSSHISSRSDYNNRVIPDVYTFNTMLDACLKKKRWEELEYVYEKMLNFGYHFNSKRHLSMVVDASRAGKVGLLETTWNHLIQSGRLPPPSVIKERAIAMLAEGDLSAAIATLVRHVSADEDVHAFSNKAWLKLLKENAERLRRETLAVLVREATHIATPSPKLQNFVMSCQEFLTTF